MKNTTDRAMIARIAANDRWAKLSGDQRTLATEGARRAAEERFYTLVDPDGVLSPEERHRQAQNARKAHFQRMALKSARARRRRGAMDRKETTHP